MEIAGEGPFKAVIRLLPGVYDEPIVISSGMMTIVGSDAILRPATQDFDTLGIRGTADVEVYRLEIDGANTASLELAAVRCEGSGASFPRLLLRDSKVHPLIVARHAKLNIRNSILGYHVLAADDARVDLDRVHFGETRGLNGTIGAFGVRTEVNITNSIFEDVNIIFNNSPALGDLSEFYIGFSTFIGPRPLHCRMSNLLRLVVFENNIFVSTLAGSPPVQFEPGHNCAFINNLAYPQDPQLGGTNIYADPQFCRPLERKLPAPTGEPGDRPRDLCRWSKSRARLRRRTSTTRTQERPRSIRVLAIASCPKQQATAENERDPGASRTTCARGRAILAGCGS